MREAEAQKWAFLDSFVGVCVWSCVGQILHRWGKRITVNPLHRWEIMEDQWQRWG